MLKKTVWTKWIVLILSCSLLVSCGGGGGGSTDEGGGSIDWMTVALGASAPVTYNEGALVTLYSVLTNTNTRTSVSMCSNPNFSLQCEKLVNITVDGIISNNIYTTSSVTKVQYAENYGSIVYQSGVGTGSVTLTTVGALGQPISGSFNVILNCVAGCTGTISMIGSFSATRQ